MFTITIRNLYASGQDAALKEMQINKDTVTVGRSGDNDVVLRQTNVSTNHAIVSLRDDGFFLEDLHSTNGTLLNKQPVRSPVRVYSTDYIEIGGSVLTLSGHPGLEKAMPSFTSNPNDSFPFDSSSPNPLPPSMASPPSLDSVVPSSPPASNVSLDSLFPYHDSEMLSSDAPRHPAPEASPFPYDDQKGGRDLPLPEQKPVRGLVDKIQAIESQVIQRKAEPEAFPRPTSTSSRPPQSIAPSGSLSVEKIDKLEKKLLQSRMRGEETRPSAVPFPKMPETISGQNLTRDVPNITVTFTEFGGGKMAKDFTGPSIIIGRSPECGISLNQALVSSRHAILELQQGQLTIRDLDSKNGTYVNNIRIHDARPLAPTDNILIGSHLLSATVINLPRGASLNQYPTETPKPYVTTAPNPTPSRQSASPPLPVEPPQKRTSFSSDFHAVSMQLHLARKSLSRSLKEAQSLSIAPHETRQVCSPLAKAVGELYSVKSRVNDKAKIQQAIDRSLEYLNEAIVLINQTGTFAAINHHVIRATSLLYIYSSDNFVNEDGYAEPITPSHLPSGSPDGAPPKQTAIARSQDERADGFQKTDKNEGSLIAKVMLLADYQNLPSVRAFAKSIADSFFFDEQQTLQFENVIDEACTNVIEHAFDMPDQGHFFVSLFRMSDTRLAIAVDDMGIPFDTEKAERGEMDGLGVTLMRAFAKEVHFINRGRRGKRVELIMELPTRLSGIFSNFRLGHYNREIVDSSTDYTIRFVRPSEAEEIPRCVFRTHEYRYYDERIYFTDNVTSLLETENQLSAMAFTKKNTAVGHMCVSRDGKDAHIGELCHLVVVPQLSGSSVASKLTMHLVKKCKADGMLGLTSKLTTSHPYEQVAFSSLGARPTGLLLGHFPESKQQSLYETAHFSEAKRQTSLFVFLPLNPIEAKTIYLPSRHASLLAELYQALELERMFVKEGSSREAVLPAVSEVHIESLKPWGVARIKVTAFGDDFIDAVRALLNELYQKMVSCIYLDLPLSLPGADIFYPQLDMLKFFYSCLIPETLGGDVLRLQHVVGMDVDLSAIHVDGHWAKKLLDYIKGEHFRLNS